LAATGSVLASTLAMVLRATRTRTPSAISTETSSSFTTLAMVPMMPPPVTTRSPRLRDANISLSCFAFCCCGRISRKYMTTMISTMGRNCTSVSVLPPSPCA
jgi:hypothetical protein